MASADLTAPESLTSDGVFDPESAAWVRGLGGSGSAYDETVARLHELLLRVAGPRCVDAAASCRSPVPNSTTWPTRPPTMP